jgi:hypothetical protein
MHFLQPGTTGSLNANVSDWYPDTHFQSEYIQVDSDEHIVDSLLYLDINPLIAYGSASTAYLGLYAYYTQDYGRNDPPGYTDLYSNRGFWDADTVTWNTAPCIGSLVATNYTEEIGWYLFQISDLYNSWVLDPSSNYGVRFVEKEKTPGDGGYDGIATLFYNAMNPGDGENPYAVPLPGTGSILLVGISVLFSLRLIARHAKQLSVKEWPAFA